MNICSAFKLFVFLTPVFVDLVRGMLFVLPRKASYLLTPNSSEKI
jgi:hypothetical protein